MAGEIHDMSAAELVVAFAARKLSPVEAARAVFARIREANPRVNAFCYTLEEEALAQARASEARWRRAAPLGAIDGVPATIKDLADIAGHPTRKGSLSTDATPAAEDSPATARLRAAGAVLVGKTTTPEFGWAGVTHSPLTGITRNPWDRTKTSGGSSGGAGAAAALGMGALHLGSDGGGSIRMPAAFCGVYGLKPTTGRIAYHPASALLACTVVGPMTRSVTDAALMMDACSGPDARDWFAMAGRAPSNLLGLETGARGLRIAYSPGLFGAEPDAPVAKAVAEAARIFRKLGADVREVGEMFALPRKSYEIYYVANMARLFRGLSAARQAEIDPGLRAFAEEGLKVTLPEYQAAMASQAVFGAEVQQALVDVDLILSAPTLLTAFEAGVEVPAGHGMTRWFDWAPQVYPFNFSTHPAASVPCGFDPDGLPTAFQLVGRKGEEALILRASRAFERERPFAMPTRAP